MLIGHSFNLADSIESIIQKTLYPRPIGFRIRVVAGYVWKLMATHTMKEKRKQTDYLGYPINLAARLLEVERDAPCLCHQSIEEIIDADKKAKRSIPNDKTAKFSIFYAEVI